MSVRKELNIEADDITIVQGDAVKDYFVKVTSVETGVTLENIPLNITFYNGQNSMVNEAITNEYGIASIPLLLTGGAWFVDVHFKGNEEYKPFIVTKEVTVEKFVRLESSITSENTVINIDEVSMNGTYYTIYLKDSYNRPITDEPVSVKVEQTGVDEPQVYVDVIIKTDYDGKIEVPFLSYDENVKITTEYKGCTRFKPTINADIVAFEDIEPRNTIEFRLCNLSDYIVGEPSADDYRVAVEYKIGDGSWDLLEEDRVFLDVFVCKEDDNRSSNRGWFYFDSMNVGTYKITICYEGMSSESGGELSNTYPFCRTFTFENTTDTRKTIAEWVEYQGGTDDAYFTLSNNKIGNLAHLKAEFDFELPFSEIYLEINGNQYQSIPHYGFKDDGTRKTIVEYDLIINESSLQYDWSIIGYGDSDFLETGYMYPLNPTLQTTTKSDATLTQTGFGYNGQTYQSIDVTVSNANASMHEKINEYYIMKLLNKDTLEEFYFYSYLIDNITPSHDEFELVIGNWRMEIVGKDTEEYKGAYYTTTAELTTEDKYYNVNEFFYTYDNWNEYGEDNIIIEEPSISTIDSNTTVAITDEFTTSNRYSLTFEVEIENNSLGSFMIGSTLNSPTMLGVKNGELTLIKYGAIIDTRKISTNISGNWEVERTGNTYDIYHNTELIYSTTELEHNTFGLMNGVIVIKGLSLRYIPSADITPSTQDYDGTVFGSNWHLELREDHLNFVDYGMLPQGAVGGGLVLLNDVPLPKDIDWDLEIGITYNNARYDRLNKLTGEIQARLYEDVSTTDSTLEYSEVLCSPTPVPNAKTIFTRKSDEGTLYYVKPLYQVSDELGKVMQKPQYMCNPYIQYKGGVECYTETGISLFSLENQYSPVFIGNDLVRAEFHRRSGYIVISRYDDATDSWYSANILKLSENLKLQLNEYNDDYAKVSFGGTTWEFYRGRPFIVVKHPNVDLKILKLVDRVYCETINNEQSMGFIEEHNTMMSTFSPQTSIQKFKQEMHIGENIRVDNFALYDVASNGNLIPLEHNATIYTTVIDNDNTLVVDKHFSGKLALNFPSSSQYLKKPSNQFSLYIGNIDVGNETSITIKARGFDENGAIHLDNNLQYGIWESSQTFTVNSNTTELRATFDCIDKVKYIDFVVIFNTNAQSTITMNKLMCHDGDSEPNWNVDTSIRNANKVQITFDETYYANLYNEYSPLGLCIIRPNQNPLTLRNISASDETVLAPYMKKATEWDKPNQVFLEYLNANRQIIDIDWEEF